MTTKFFSDDVDAKVLDTDASRYDLAKLTAIYTNILKTRSDFSSYHVPQLIKKALDDILSGAITPQEIIAAHKKHTAITDDDEKKSDKPDKKDKPESKSHRKQP